MNAKEQHTIFKDTGVKTFYLGKALDNPYGASVIFKGPQNVLDDILSNSETKPIVEASRYIYEDTKITRWIA